MANLFSIPQYIITGENAVQKSMDHIKNFGKKAFIVTDSAMVTFGNVQKITNELDKNGIQYSIYAEINSEPTHTMIDRGVAIYKEEQCDFLIGIGGGSPLDAMKAIGAVYANGGKISDYIGKLIEKELPPTCAIPTTAGTGSEATKVSIITNTDTGVKMLLNDPKLMASLAVVDPVFTLTVPPEIHTGMTPEEGANAFVNAIIVLLRVLNVKTLQDFGISKEDYFRCIPKMATDALDSGSPANTRRVPSKEEIIRLYEELWEENEAIN
jgi:Alcohol dehydrogenase, class IV